MTRRQGQVLGLICAGKSNTRIARELRISEYTVKRYVTMLFNQYGVDCRTALAVTAIARGQAEAADLADRDRLAS